MSPSSPTELFPTYTCNPRLPHFQGLHHTTVYMFMGYTYMHIHDLTHTYDLMNKIN